jgi:hypothetical protein
MSRIGAMTIGGVTLKLSPMSEKVGHLVFAFQLPAGGVGFFIGFSVKREDGVFEELSLCIAVSVPRR